MLTRRTFLGAASAALLPGTAQQPTAKKKLAVVTTVWTYRSHAWHMAERFLHGYPVAGKWHRPPIEVVSAYVDQTPDGDLSRDRAREFGFKVYPTIAEALRCGGDRLAVDAVLVIGEHGKYPRNDIGQIQYPRYEFFKQIVEVFAKDRAGLLFSLARALHGLGLSISLSKINTEGNKVADVFYVNELDGAKVAPGPRFKAIREALLDASRS